MHEVGIMEQTLAIALSHAQEQGATRIHRLCLRVGALSGVEPDALKFAFDVVTQGTIAADATLTIEAIPAICYCDHCQLEFQPPDWIYECPHCHQLTWDVRQGKELELASLEVS
jgi:hydrogenase nickel incorporation protein HypA/HybF